MGIIANSCSSRPKEQIKTSFDQFEIEKVRKIFNEIKEKDEELK